MSLNHKLWSGSTESLLNEFKGSPAPTQQQTRLAQLREQNSMLRGQFGMLSNEATTMEQEISQLVDLSILSVCNASQEAVEEWASKVGGAQEAGRKRALESEYQRIYREKQAAAVAIRAPPAVPYQMPMSIHQPVGPLHAGAFVSHLKPTPGPQLAHSADRQATPVPSTFIRPVQRRPKRIRALPTDEKGNLILPVVLGRANSRVSIYNIGEIVPSQEQLHNESFIYPVGFMAKRKFPSYLDSTKRVFYTCKILPTNADRIAIEPVCFQIGFQGNTKNTIEGSSMAALWSMFLDRFTSIEAFPSLANFQCGEEFFGLDHEGIRHYIQDLPEASQCSRYKFVDYLAKSAVARKPTTVPLQQPPTAMTYPGKATGAPHPMYGSGGAMAAGYGLPLPGYPTNLAATYPWSQLMGPHAAQQQQHVAMGTRNPLLDTFAIQPDAVSSDEEDEEEFEELNDIASE